MRCWILSFRTVQRTSNESDMRKNVEHIPSLGDFSPYFSPEVGYMGYMGMLSNNCTTDVIQVG